MDIPNKQNIHEICKFHFKKITPEQLKQNTITVHPNQKLDTEEGESNTNEQESTISNKEEVEFTTSEELTEEYSTFSDMSKQDSESDINIDDTQDEQNKHLKHCKFIIYTTQQCMIKMI